MHGTQTQEYNDPRTPLHAEIGHKSIRIFNPYYAAWSTIEASEGVRDFSYLRYMVDTAIAAGLRPLLAFRGIPAWTAADDPDLNTQFLAFLDAISTEFGGAVDYHLWNEPDAGSFFPGNDVTDFIAMMTGAVAAIKANAPSAKVIAPCVTANGASFLSSLMASGVMAGADGLSVNCYIYPSQPEALRTSILPLKAIANAYDLPLHNTELTWHSFKTTPGAGTTNYPTMMSDPQASAYVVRSDLALLSAGVASNYWFGPDEDFATSVQFGCIAMLDSGDVTTLLAPALARQALIAELTGAQMLDWSKTGTLYSYRFRKGAQTGRVLWRGDGDTGNVDLTAYASGKDMFGAAITLTSSYAVTTPIYVYD